MTRPASQDLTAFKRYQKVNKFIFIAMPGRLFLRLSLSALFLLWFCQPKAVAQTNLLLNGGFEDINTCTEYTAECGVEAWFYLRDVKVQMITNDTNVALLGYNSFGIICTWRNYTDFVPVIGTILPCGLQAGHRYTFKGLVNAGLSNKLSLTLGACAGERFYVPNRVFSKPLKPERITTVTRIPNTKFFEFEYSFIATGTERYLTFGTYVEEEEKGGQHKILGEQSVSLILDNFRLIPADPKETTCNDYLANKERIYQYNFRHKEMDYSLFGKGELAIKFPPPDSNFITLIKEPPPPPKIDTLKLGDVLFDFNKANLKPGALKMLEEFFITKASGSIDSMYIEGHTDSVGSDKRNMELSLQRCESIKQWLLLNDIVEPSALQIHPFGKTKPIASNSTPQGRALNRRVEMVVFRKP